LQRSYDHGFTLSVPDRNISEVKGIESETFEALALRAVQALQALHQALLLGLHALLVLSGLRP